MPLIGRLDPGGLLQKRVRGRVVEGQSLLWGPKPTLIHLNVLSGLVNSEASGGVTEKG